MTSLLIDGYASDQKAENWKPIPGYEGLYDASDLGRIRSHPGKVTSSARFTHRVWKSRIMKPKHPTAKARQDGRLTLWKNGTHTDQLISRLVASAWIRPPEEGETVNHINGDWSDNRPSNLEWVSLSDNIKHGFETGLYANVMRAVLLREIGGNEARDFPSMSEASRWLGRNEKYISVLTSRRRGYGSVAVGVDGRLWNITAFSKGEQYQ